MDVGAVEVEDLGDADAEVDLDEGTESPTGGGLIGFCNDENNGPCCPMTVNATFPLLPTGFVVTESPDMSSTKSNKSALRTRSRVITCFASSSK